MTRITFLLNLIFLSVMNGFTQRQEKISPIPDFDSLIMINTELPKYYNLRNTVG